MRPAPINFTNFLMNFLFFLSLFESKCVWGPSSVGKQTFSNQILEILLLFLTRTSRILNILGRIGTVTRDHTVVIISAILIAIEITHIVHVISIGGFILVVLWLRALRGRSDEVIWILLLSLVFTLVFFGIETVINHEFLQEVVFCPSKGDKSISLEGFAIASAIGNIV